jgi:hypothetical protein
MYAYKIWSKALRFPSGKCVTVCDDTGDAPTNNVIKQHVEECAIDYINSKAQYIRVHVQIVNNGATFATVLRRGAWGDSYKVHKITRVYDND